MRDANQDRWVLVPSPSGAMGFAQAVSGGGVPARICAATRCLCSAPPYRWLPAGRDETVDHREAFGAVMRPSRGGVRIEHDRLMPRMQQRIEFPISQPRSVRPGGRFNLYHSRSRISEEVRTQWTGPERAEINDEHSFDTASCSRAGNRLWAALDWCGGKPERHCPLS
jgi:hypothetical protein